MADDFFDRKAERRMRRDERRRVVRRRRRIALLVVVAVALAAVVAVVFATRGAGRGEGGEPAGGGAAGQGSSEPAAAGSPATSSAAAANQTSLAAETSAAPAPTAPPLHKPTKRDPLRVYFGGDSLSGMPAVMFEQRAVRSGLMKVTIDYQESSRLSVPDPVDWPARLRTQLGARRYDVGVFLIGANDTGMPMIADGQSTVYPDKAWQREYQDRVETLMLMMLRRGVERVYWIGLPVMPKYGQNEAAKGLNRLFEGAAARHADVVYVDAYAALATESGTFDPALRSGDGVHYTNEGAGRIADAVWEAMREDWRKPRPSATPDADEASP